MGIEPMLVIFKYFQLVISGLDNNVTSVLGYAMLCRLLTNT